MKKCDPYKEAFNLLCGKEPTFKGDPRKLGDDDFEALQEWALNNVKLEWATGGSVIDAVCELVEQAKDNANFEMLHLEVE